MVTPQKSTLVSELVFVEDDGRSLLLAVFPQRGRQRPDAVVLRVILGPRVRDGQRPLIVGVVQLRLDEALVVLGVWVHRGQA